jgi:hypothetical protein
MPTEIRDHIQQAALNATRRKLEWSVLMAFWLFVLGWATDGFTILDIGKYSILLIYVAALPFCIRTTGRSVVFVSLPLISTVLSAVVAVMQRVSPMSVVSQGALQLLAIFFASGVAAIDWRRYFDPFSKIATVIGIPLVAIAGYQVPARTYHWKFAFLSVTNQQSYAEGGFQRGWEKDHFTRASSTFAEPSELGYYSLWLLVIGLCATKGRWRTLALLLAFSGFLFSQSLSGALGAAVVVMVYVATNPINMNVVRQIAITLIASTMAILIIVPLAPEAFDKFSERITQAVTLDNRADSGRVDHLPANWQAFKDAPLWGLGLAGISNAAENGTDVTTFTYFLMLIERGLVGTVFFLAPWIWLCYRSIKLPKADALRNVCVLFSVLNLFSFGYTSAAYSLQFWLALGICASSVLGTYLPVTHRAVVLWSPIEQERIPPIYRGL